ncbi:MAG: sulfurtransferase-like selenium metabolism protein YedF [Bacteroidales bacterium]
MRTIDTRGQQCPAPLIATKRALKESDTGDSFEVVTDNKTALDNISRFLKDNRTAYSVMQKSDIWTITVTKSNKDVPLTSAEVYCTPEIPHFSKGDFIIVFNSDKMGEGAEELGKMLIFNFIKAIKDLDVLPGKMVFYNNGVKLGSIDSPVYESLKELGSMGVEMLFCATCTKYYSLEEKIQVGTLSNMFEIAQVMTSAGNIIKP